MSDLHDELQSLLNRHSKENGSNTPDHVLAEYLVSCLAAFDHAMRMRALWYGRIDVPGKGSVPYRAVALVGPQGDEP